MTWTLISGITTPQIYNSGMHDFMLIFTISYFSVICTLVVTNIVSQYTNKYLNCVKTIRYFYRKVKTTPDMGHYNNWH